MAYMKDINRKNLRLTFAVSLMSLRQFTHFLAVAVCVLFLPPRACLWYLAAFSSIAATFSCKKSSFSLARTLFFLLASFATDLVYGPHAKRPEWMRDSRTFPLLDASGRAMVETWNESRLRRTKEP